MSGRTVAHLCGRSLGWYVCMLRWVYAGEEAGECGHSEYWYRLLPGAFAVWLVCACGIQLPTSVFIGVIHFLQCQRHMALRISVPVEYHDGVQSEY